MGKKTRVTAAHVAAAMLAMAAAEGSALAQERSANLRPLKEYGAMLGLNEACRASGEPDRRMDIERFLASKVALMEHMLASQRIPDAHGKELSRVLDLTRRRAIDRTDYAVMRETGLRLMPDVLKDACKGIATQSETGIEMDQVARALFDAQVAVPEPVAEAKQLSRAP